jgi:hypothetical protein
MSSLPYHEFVSRLLRVSLNRTVTLRCHEDGDKVMALFGIWKQNFVNSKFLSVTSSRRERNDSSIKSVSSEVYSTRNDAVLGDAGVCPALFVSHVTVQFLQGRLRSKGTNSGRVGRNISRQRKSDKRGTRRNEAYYHVSFSWKLLQNQRKFARLCDVIIFELVNILINLRVPGKMESELFAVAP